MDIEWHIRLIERLVKTNPDSTIRDYAKIVGKPVVKIKDKEEEWKQFVRESKIKTRNWNCSLSDLAVKIGQARLVKISPIPKTINSIKRI